MTGFALVGAAAWLQGTLLGTLAAIVATIAVAGLGLLMLQGRLPWRRVASAILGCFLIFGAPVIARGILGSAAPNGNTAERSEPLVETQMPAAPPAGAGYDPYAGASVPDRR